LVPSLPTIDFSLIFLFHGQWYANFVFSNGTKYNQAFPGGNDSATNIENNGVAGAIWEGNPNQVYSSGQGNLTDLMYAWKVSSSGTLIVVWIYYTSNLNFTSSTVNGVPPNTSDFTVANTCPKTYEFIMEAGGSIPAANTSVDTCVP